MKSFRIAKRRAVVLAVACLAAVASTVTVWAEQNKETLETSVGSSERINYMVFPDSSERALSFADIYMLSQSDIRIAKNEIYARHGRKFASEDLQLYFSEMEWYHGTIEPDAFDPSVFNEIEKENIAFLNNEEEKGTGAQNESVISSEIEEQKRYRELESAAFCDKIGFSELEESVLVRYKKDSIHTKLADNESENSADVGIWLGTYYEKDGEIFGNVGFRKNVSYLNEGELCAWFRGHEYRVKLQQSTELADHLSYYDTYILYEDNRQLLAYDVIQGHESGTTFQGKWLLTDQAVYVGNYESTTRFEWNQSRGTEIPGCWYAFAEYGGNVYLNSALQAAVRADDQTMENKVVLGGTYDEVQPQHADGGNFIVRKDSGLYQYQMDTGEQTFLDQASDWNSYALSGSYLYGMKRGRNWSVIERISLESREKEIVCILEGIGYGTLEKAEGSRLYVSIGPEGADWTSDHGAMNLADLSIDLETGEVFVLGAGWYS